MASFQMWHGGRKWLGGPEVQPAKAGRYECGPGIYLTNRYATARKYAKGPNVTTLVTLKDPAAICWLETAKLAYENVVSFVTEAKGLRKRSCILADLAKYSGDAYMPAAVLVNLCVNHEALTGPTSVKLAAWFVEQGIDASRHRAYGQEQWIIVFNPKIIVKHSVIFADNVDISMYDLPTI